MFEILGGQMETEEISLRDLKILLKKQTYNLPASLFTFLLLFINASSFLFSPDFAFVRFFTTPILILILPYLIYLNSTHQDKYMAWGWTAGLAYQVVNLSSLLFGLPDNIASTIRTVLILVMATFFFIDYWKSRK